MSKQSGEATEEVKHSGYHLRHSTQPTEQTSAQDEEANDSVAKRIEKDFPETPSSPGFPEDQA